MIKLKVIAMDGNDVLVLTEEVKRLLNVRAGDTLNLIETAEGTLTVSSSSNDSRQQMTVAENVMREDYKILRTLAEGDGGCA